MRAHTRPTAWASETEHLPHCSRSKGCWEWRGSRQCWFMKRSPRILIKALAAWSSRCKQSLLCWSSHAPLPRTVYTLHGQQRSKNTWVRAQSQSFTGTSVYGSVTVWTLHIFLWKFLSSAGEPAARRSLPRKHREMKHYPPQVLRLRIK